MVPAEFVSGLGYDYLHSALVASACVTLIFFLIDRWNSHKKIYTDWNPEELPEYDNSWINIPLYSTLIEAIFTLLLLAMINGLLPLPVLSIQQEINIDFQWSESAGIYLPWANAVLIASLVLSTVNLFTPYWTMTKYLINSSLDLVFAWILINVALLDSVITSVPGLEQQASGLKPLLSYTDPFLKSLIEFIAVLIVIDVILNLYRMNQHRR